MTTIARARAALQNLHREHLMERMHKEDREYATVTHAIFQLLDRMEAEENHESD